MAEEKDDWLDDLEGPEEKESDLGQSDIDALLSGADGISPPVSEEEDLGQADIDALLSGNDLAPGELQNEDAESGGLDQSDIEALLSSTDLPIEDQPFSDPDQDEIDKLFSEPEADDLADAQTSSAEDFDFADAFANPEPPSSQTQLPPDFDDFEFKLEADIPDIPDVPAASGGWDESVSFLDEETKSIPDQPVTAPVAKGAFSEAEASAEPQQQAKWRPLLANRKLLFAVGGGAGLLILLVTGLFLFKDGGGEPHQKAVQETATEVTPEKAVEAPPQPPAVTQQEESPQKEIVETAPPAPSTPEIPAVMGPTISDLDLVMPEGSSELAITLVGKDPENLPLEYEFQSMPEHGQISGHAPILVYSARPDFSGQDSFAVRVTNGKQFSASATVTIRRETPLAIPEPPVVPAVSEETAQQTPPPSPEAVPVKQESIAARNVSYTISKSLVVPWEKIWRKVNSQPYTNEVGVDIVRAPQHGTLEAANGDRSIYTPDRSFSGQDTIRYRFTLGDLRTATKTVTIRVKSTNMPPELHIAPYAEVYAPGDTVILNAGQTKDDIRDSVQFSWQQISGVPVVIKSLNSEGSQIAFVAPASFNTVSNPGVVIRVTATDEKGWSVSRELQIRTQSRRNTAIWR